MVLLLIIGESMGNKTLIIATIYVLVIIALIGRDDGIISVFSLDKKSKYKKVDLIIELKNHLNSITGLWYDYQQKKLYTVSTDKRFLVSDIVAITTAINATVATRGIHLMRLLWLFISFMISFR